MRIEPLPFNVKIRGTLILPIGTSLNNLAQYFLQGTQLDDRINAQTYYRSKKDFRAASAVIEGLVKRCFVLK